MFWPDVVGLKQFYASPCGMYAAQLLRTAIRRVWAAIPDDTVVGVGFCTPFLGMYGSHNRAALALMPAAQGVVHWPTAGAGRTVLCDEDRLPLPTGRLQHLLLVHVLEHTEMPRALLEECWRVLQPGGRLLLVVPNRRGLWVRASHGPFAYGRGFSPWQLRALLADERFTPTTHDYALYMPPIARRSWLRLARVMEGIGRRFFGALGGVIVMEAEKQIAAPIHAGTGRRPRRFYHAPSPQPAVAMHIKKRSPHRESCAFLNNNR